MMNTTATQTKQKRIEDLTLHEVDIVYSLMRVGDWSDLEIGRVYKLSMDDVHEVFDNYIQLREAVLRNPSGDMLPQAPELELTTGKARKRRSDALYATAKERQAAYRARLQENLRAGIEQLSPTVNTDTSIPEVEEPSVTVCEAPVTEIGPEEAEMQHSGSYGTSEESYDISESVPLSVTPAAYSEREELRVIEE
jgi:hypothetical protein